MGTILIIAFAISVSALVLWGATEVARQRRERLARHAVRGSALIIDVKTTHSSSGDEPIVKFGVLLTFEDGGAELNAALAFAVHPLDAHRLQLGARFPAHINPDNARDFSIDFGGVTGVQLSDC